MTTQTKAVDWDNEEQVANQWFKWTCEIQVNGTWVADGFELTQERLKEMIEREIGYANSCETKARILTSPDTARIRLCQGLETE